MRKSNDIIFYSLLALCLFTNCLFIRILLLPTKQGSTVGARVGTSEKTKL